MANGTYLDEHYDTDNNKIGETKYCCTTSGLGLQNIDPSSFDFSFLTSDDGVLGNMKLILETLKTYNENTNAYDVDGQNNFSKAYEELKSDVERIEGLLAALEAELNGQVAAIKSEIVADHAWAYCATFSDESWGD